ncbi:hypothetical protein [Halomonas sp. A3H3]|uniref:hypothetical protein n=1 Tax=Halomonas sp. A3H3 TaxID=1346287 RepID=UPI0006B3CF33|nr:hypothetical protein [Halomonas sp. A3H3]
MNDAMQRLRQKLQGAKTHTPSSTYDDDLEQQQAMLEIYPVSRCNSCGNVAYPLSCYCTNPGCADYARRDHPLLGNVTLGHINFQGQWLTPSEHFCWIDQHKPSQG